MESVREENIVGKSVWLLVINPVSGGRKKTDMLEKVINFLEAQNIHSELYFMTGFQDVIQLKHKIKELGPEKIIAMGGDGTCNIVAICVMGTDMVMGTIPAGSANGMALDLGIPRDTDQALGVLMRNRVRKLDLLSINGKYVSLHLSDAGLNAQLIYRFEQSGQRGGRSYFKEMLRSLLRLNSFSVYLSCNGKHYKKRAVMLAFANGSRYGSGAVLNPGGKPDDGVFEICMIRPVKWYRIPALTWHLFRGSVNIIPEMKIWTTDKAFIRFKRSILVQADGEILGHHKQLEISVLPGVVKFLV